MLAQQPLTAAEMARFQMAAAEMTHRFALLRPAGTRMARPLT